MALRINIDKCTGCGDCLAVCPFDAMELVDDKARVKDNCNVCGACQQACDCGAIVIETPKEDKVTADGDFKGVWVFGEQRNGQLKGVVYELVSRGRELADTLGTQLSVVCLGHNIEGIDQLIHYGADKVHLVDSPVLAECQEDVYAKALVDSIREHKPEILLAGATSLGRSLIPRVAAILETGLTADCTGLEIDKGSCLLLQTRPTFGGNIMATITCQQKRPQMSTVRPHVFHKGMPDTGRKGEIIKVDFDKEAVTSRTRLLRFVDSMADRVNIEDADSIVCGGRGLGKKENFQMLAELAGALGAALGSSRPPVDDGWIAYSHQVGQTGKTVSPRLYIACGISGAVQHLAGMQTSEVVVAINEDPQAPIFDVATYGIVGDLFKIVPLLTKRLKERSG